MAGAALCLGRRVGHRASFPHETFARRQHRCVAYHSDAYCQYTDSPAVAGAVSLVVAAVVAENERVRRS